MARGILLDSSVVIPHLRGRLDLAAQIAPSEPLFLPLTALGELYKGVFKSSQPQKNRLLLETFLQTVAVLHPDMATALHYAPIGAFFQLSPTPEANHSRDILAPVEFEPAPLPLERSCPLQSFEQNCDQYRRIPTAVPV